MTALRAIPQTNLHRWLGVSALLHATFVAAILFLGRGRGEVLPPVYRVDLVAAPAGERAIGEVRPAPKPAEPEPAARPAPKRAEQTPELTAPIKTPLSKKAPTQATQSPDAKSVARNTPAPRAGGGPEGGKGADVANVHLSGVDFPYPAYLQNIVRQIALRFKPEASDGARTAEVVFMIARDGTVRGFNFRRRSGSYDFDLMAQGALEEIGNRRAFGPLPSGFQDDVLTVIFTFDATVIR